MKNFWKYMIRIVVHVGVLSALYVGFECGVVGFRNLVVFCIFVSFVGSVIIALGISLMGNEGKAKLMLFDSSKLDLIFGAISTIFLAWHGYFLTSSALLLGVMLMQFAQSDCNEARREIEDAKNLKNI